MRTLRTGPAVGLLGQLAVLSVLASTVGLGTAGWLVGTLYGLVTAAALTRGLHRSGAASLGPANRVTLTRATLVGGVTALAADSFQRSTPVVLFVTLTSVALILDAVDGSTARRMGCCSPLGARFDMEIDAFLILVLSVYVAGPAGLWVLAIGAMRYAYVGASWLLPWMQGTLPPRFWRKTVAAVQGIVLAVAAADVLAQPVLIAVLAVSLALLAESFGRDVLWLWHHRPIESARPLFAHSADALPVTRRSTVEPVAARPRRVVRSRYRPSRARRRRAAAH